MLRTTSRTTLRTTSRTTSRTTLRLMLKRHVHGFEELEEEIGVLEEVMDIDTGEL
jgi:hypothetical protein